MVTVSLSLALLVAATMGSTQIVSWIIVSEALTDELYDQLAASARQGSREVLAYLQVASSTSRYVAQMYSVSHARAPDRAPQRLVEDFGRHTWSLFEQNAYLSSVLVAQPREEALINQQDSTCNTDVVLLSSVYKADLNANTTGTGLETAPPPANPASVAGHMKVQLIQGNDRLRDPLAFKDVLYQAPCNESFGGGDYLWANERLPGSWADRDTGLTAPRWSKSVLVVGSYPEQSVIKVCHFDLPGPPWAPQGAFGAVSVQVSGDGVGEDRVTMQMIVENLARQQSTKDTEVFILTASGELLAASSRDQEVVVRAGADDPQPGRLLGLVRGDDPALVRDPIRTVARQLLQDNCDAEADGSLSCRWADIQEFQDIANYTTATVPISDPAADSLNLVLVHMASTSVVTDSVDKLQQDLWRISIYSFVVFCCFFLFLSRQVTIPLRDARDKMFLLGDMKIEEAMKQHRGCRCRCRTKRLTECSDLEHSFFHAAHALQEWHAREMRRRSFLLDERAKRVRGIVEKAVKGAGQLVHPMVLVKADDFTRLERLTSFEEMRNGGRLMFLDTEEEVLKFKLKHSIIFLSHQWLAWGFPDDKESTHLKAMKSAVKIVAQQMRAKDKDSARHAWGSLYVWVDYCSIAQEHRGMQMLAVSSLPVYASSADAFVIVAPPAEHQSHSQCDLHSYKARGWCRAEMLAKICSSGLENFFVLSTGGDELERVTEEWLPALSTFVFEGEFSCCQRGHEHGLCDKESLVEPVLGLYSLVLRQVRDGRHDKTMQPILRHIRESKARFFPKAHYLRRAGQADDERELFGPLVEALEEYMEQEFKATEDECSICVPHSTPKNVYWVF